MAQLDPRWDASRNRKLLKQRQPGLNAEEDFLVLQTETNRRRLAEAAAPATPPQQAAVNNTQPPTPPVQVGPDRLHKKGSMYVTVSPKPDPDDPVPDPAWISTIQGGIDYAATTLVPLLTDPTDDVTVLVLGGVYAERITISSDRLKIKGVGRPAIFGTVTITSGCASTIVSDLDIFSGVPEGSDWHTFINLSVASGIENGDDISDIQIFNCRFFTDGCAVKSSRRTYFENCKAYITFNANLYNLVPAWRIQYDPISVQTRFTIMESCEIWGVNNPVGPYFDKSWAFDATIKSNLGAWNNAPVNTGVLMNNCKVVGWTTNYGWTLRKFMYHGTEGNYVNDTAGSVHHLQFCNSDTNSIAETYFDGGWVGCEYLAELKDSSAVATTGICNVWIREFVHGGNQDNLGGPIGGTAVHTLLHVGTVPAAANVYKVDSATGALTGFFAPAGVELAVGGGSVFNVNIAAMKNPFKNI